METHKPLSDDIWGKVFRRSDNIVSRKIAGDLFLVPIRGNLADMQRLFSLNPVAEFVWHNLDTKTLHGICDEVVSSFEVKREEAESDIRDFIAELFKANLIGES
jgi:hypothetical protein